MTLHELSFGKIIIICDDIAEIIVDTGVEIDLNMVDEFHDFLLSHLVSPFSVLINRINTYSHSFDAQMKIGTLEELNVIAIAVYSRASELSTNAIAVYPRKKNWNHRIFDNREEALEWIESKQTLYR